MNFKLKIKRIELDPYKKPQWGADVFCQCCGRGIPNRDSCHVVIVKKGSFVEGGPEYGGSLPGEVEMTFAPIEWEKVKGYDSVEWGSFVGSHCAKMIPKEFKVSQKKVVRNMIWY